MSKKVLLLCMDKSNYFFPYIDYENIVLAETYKPTKNKLQYYTIKLFKKIPYLSNFCYGDWKKRISEFDKIVVLDEGYDPPMQIVFKKYKIPAYVYAWNSVLNSQTKLYRSIKRTNSCEVYSFDKCDCIKYNLKYNSTMYPSKIVDKYVGSQHENDKYMLFFVGLDKGRRGKLQEIKGLLDNWEMDHYFRIMNANERMEYSEYLSILSRSTAILDIVQEGQNGPTMRVMESLFFKKKLVTTNCGIKEYDFYNPSNIFIIGEDPTDELPQFLKGKYEDLPRGIVEQYDVGQWVQRFVLEEEEVK